jgi:hypothetical protein
MNDYNKYERDKNVVHPTWNSGYQRYDLSIDEVIQSIIYLGYDLKKIDEELPEEDEDITINDESNYVLEIHSDKGYVISDNTVLVLKPRVYQDGIDITDATDVKHFKWVRSSSNPKADAEWNLRHSTGIKNLEVTHEDVYQRAIFHCAFLTGKSESQFVQNMYAAYMASIND